MRQKASIQVPVFVRICALSVACSLHRNLEVRMTVLYDTHKLNLLCRYPMIYQSSCSCTIWNSHRERLGMLLPVSIFNSWYCKSI